jgi:heme exporter protein C
MTLGNRLVPVLLLVSVVMFGAAPYVIDTAPYESTMGLVQRIFYFHVPVAILLLVTGILCGVGSGIFLSTRGDRSDAFALACAEITVLFGALVLVMGPLWARKAWGVWWAWEARLTTTLVMWMIFSAYLLLRKFGGPGSEVLSAAVGVFGSVLAPFVYWSVEMWTTMHPRATVVPDLPAPMMGPFLWCMVAWMALTAALIVMRMRLELSRVGLERAYVLLEEQ